MRCNGCGRIANRLRRGLCEARCYPLLLATGERAHVQVRGIPGRRFVHKVDMSGPVPAHAPDLGPCWLWLGALDVDGYGVFRSGPDAVVSAHVWIHEQVHGPVLGGNHVDHVCHDPGACLGVRGDVHRRCVSPLHTREATPAQNNERSNSPTAANSRKTECDWGHPLLGGNLYVHPQRGTRHCRECQRRRSQNYAARRRSGLQGDGLSAGSGV